MLRAASFEPAAGFADKRRESALSDCVNSLKFALYSDLVLRQALRDAQDLYSEQHGRPTARH